jgi:two-component system phosphate regulon sensor histidine kinase PhoR
MKYNTYLVIAGVFAFGIINVALFYAYPGKFSAIAYVTFLIIPLIIAVVVVFTRFSFLFTSRISEQEEEKKLLRERQKEIVENMIEGLVVYNRSGKILSVNGAAEKLLNVSGSEILYKTKAEIKKKSPLLDALFKDLSSEDEREHSLKDKHGKEYVFKIISVELNKERGEMLKIIRDISREKHLDKMKSEYLTIMSHKFLTPLNSIKWTAPNLLDADVKDSDKERFIENIMKSTEGLIKLTSLLLRVTEMEEGSFGYKLGAVNLQEIIENTIKDRKDGIKKKKISMTFHKPKTPIIDITADKDRIKVVIDNFVDNAIKYTPDNGKIDIMLEDDNVDIKFSIQDNGIGISKGAQGDIFKKFIRDQRAIAMHTEGSGLGLFIVKNIIKEHGGEVGFTTSEDGGSTFFFTLPKFHKGGLNGL